MADSVALEFSLVMGWITRLVLARWVPVEIDSKQVGTLAVVVLLLPVFQTARGLYPGYGMGPVGRLREQSYSTVLFFAALAIWDYLVLGGRWSRGMLLFAVVYALLLVPLMEALVRAILVRIRAWGWPVIILGAGQTGAMVTRVLRENPELGLVPVALFDDDPAKQGKLVEGVPVVGPLEAASRWARCTRVAIVAMPGAGRTRLGRIVRDLQFPRVILVPDLLGLESLWVQAKDLGGVLGLEIRKNLLLVRNRIVKYVLDYSLAIPLFLASLPLIAAFALWIKWVSPGPVFFAQEREGIGGRPIRVWKLRTMYPDAEERLERYLDENPGARAEWERYFKLKDDPRILPGVGHFLRRTSLDELPQLWNVLRGEMSLVGPRPFPRYHLEAFPSEFRELRCRVRPGMTGLWQVTARSEGDLRVQEALDTYYIRNWSIWLDLYILAKTVRVILSGKGAY
ncbi:undecaprenyl-phosphate galactose phosphotransferase WbaP [Thermaerobacter composti]|uniref:Undecaprenyl-phosphate galactose phosphotransferase WbaP n=1 Tax=Thermaerobacter composti TaxID=554949 RepID=A0ABZ0QTQ3_9FIRM|nr:undecaprenyl-phosphate galactose phosphotransferase WbaP [Thermaerobacter composti]WPD20237.1 undecaprenyl-phosphate galactose phosphotransferase WbaP [Thermaerobacter composti]